MLPISNSKVSIPQNPPKFPLIACKSFRQTKWFNWPTVSRPPYTNATSILLNYIDEYSVTSMPCQADPFSPRHIYHIWIIVEGKFHQRCSWYPFLPHLPSQSWSWSYLSQQNTHWQIYALPMFLPTLLLRQLQCFSLNQNSSYLGTVSKYLPTIHELAPLSLHLQLRCIYFFNYLPTRSGNSWTL